MELERQVEGAGRVAQVVVCVVVVVEWTAV